jgi:hypothetical protein
MLQASIVQSLFVNCVCTVHLRQISSIDSGRAEWTKMDMSEAMLEGEHDSVNAQRFIAIVRDSDRECIVWG